MCEIRHAAASDLPHIVEIYNHYIRETPITFDVTVTDLEKRAVWFEQFSREGRSQILVAHENGHFTGYAHSTKFRPKAAYAESVETTIYLDPMSRGKGVGRRLLASLLDNLREENTHRAYAIITLPNEASISLHQNLGFEPLMVLSEVGRKFDRYWDTQWMEFKF